MKRLLSVSLVCLMAVAVGCDDDSDENSSRRGRGYLPPAGFGAILIENNTFSDWNVSIDGNQLGRVSSESFMVQDALPGRHTVHLDVHRGREEEDAAVDVIEGQLSVLRINGTSFDSSLDVFEIVP